MPQWIRDLLHERWGDEHGLDISFEMADQTGLKKGRSHPAPKAEIAVNAVCGTCNGGWMSRLEGAVKPFLGLMILGDKQHLDLGQQADLAHWAAKTAVLFEHYMPNTIVLSPSDRSDIFERRQAPSGFHIRLAFREDVDGSPVSVTAISAHATPPGTVAPPDAQPNCFSVMFTAGHFVMAVVGGPGVDNPERWQTGGNLPLMIWPPTAGGIEWPPASPRLQGADGLRSFAEGFFVRITNDAEFKRPDARRHIPGG